MSCVAQRPADPNEDSLLSVIPFKMYTGGVIALEARLDNISQPLNFILDTGSGGISLDSSTCSDLSIPLKPTDTVITGIGGRNKVSFAFDQKMQTGKLTTEHLDFYVNDYTLLSSTYGEKIDGVIGYSFLSKYIFNINFDSGIIKIYRPGKFRYDEGGKVFHPDFTRLASQKVTVKDGRKVTADFYFDSGAGLNLLMSDEFEKDSSVLFHRRKPVVTEAQGLGGKKPMRLTVIKQVKVGPFRFRNVPVYLYNDESNILSYPRNAGLLGNDMIRRFNVTLNYNMKEIHLKPNSHFSDEFDYAYTGMSLYFSGGKIFAEDIIAKSPAELGGVYNGDEVISVAGNISGNIQQYKNLLQHTTTPIKVIVKEMTGFYSYP